MALLHQVETHGGVTVPAAYIRVASVALVQKDREDGVKLTYALIELAVFREVAVVEAHKAWAAEHATKLAARRKIEADGKAAGKPPAQILAELDAVPLPAAPAGPLDQARLVSAGYDRFKISGVYPAAIANPLEWAYEQLKAMPKFAGYQDA